MLKIALVGCGKIADGHAEEIRRKQPISTAEGIQLTFAWLRAKS
jgi:hypothetical protein